MWSYRRTVSRAATGSPIRAMTVSDYGGLHTYHDWLTGFRLESISFLGDSAHSEWALGSGISGPWGAVDGDYFGNYGPLDKWTADHAVIPTNTFCGSVRAHLFRGDKQLKACLSGLAT
jgi:hypothetical protein